MLEQKNNRWPIFINSFFFVLGFSLIFSLVGILLQTFLANVSYGAQLWLGRLGGTIIILFGLSMTGLLHLTILETEHKLHVQKKNHTQYMTSFLFGAAFAVGWTPCVGAILGAILTLAVVNPGTAFFLLMAYSLGLGLPFLIVGAFTDKAKKIIPKAGKLLNRIRIIFGVVLIAIGILVFTGQLNRIANLQFATNFLLSLHLGTISATTLNISVAFFAGLVSFLSPCVLPLIPAFLAYLGTTTTHGGEDGREN